MYGLSPPPPPPLLADPPPLSSSEPHAPTAKASAATATASPANRFVPMTASSFRDTFRSDRALARHVGVDGDEDHQAEDHVLPLLRDRHDLQPVVEDGDDQCPDDGADDRALA